MEGEREEKQEGERKKRMMMMMMILTPFDLFCSEFFVFSFFLFVFLFLFLFFSLFFHSFNNRCVIPTSSKTQPHSSIPNHNNTNNVRSTKR